MGVKNRQDGVFKMLFSEENFMEEDCLSYQGLKIHDKRIKVKDFLLWKVREIHKESVLAILLKRIFEINHLKTKAVTAPLEEINKVKLVKYKIKL